MTNEQTNEGDTQGDETNKEVKTGEEPLSLVDEAKKVRDEIKGENDRRERILADEQKLRANDLLGGTSGGNVETKQISPEEKKKADAKEFFKGTQLEGAIDKL